MVDEDERKYSVRLSTAAARYRNVHYSVEKTTMFLEGPNESINTLISRYHEKQRKEAYKEVAYLSRAEGESVCTRNESRLAGRKIYAEILAVTNRSRTRNSS